jgi:Cu/Zn superoxide dismutase
MIYRSLLASAIFAVLLTARALAQEPQTLTVTMHALNGSNEDGTAILTQEANGVRVTLDLKNAPDDPQPTHIHIGTCGAINKAPEYGLQATVSGKASTVVPGISLADLLKGHYAVNVHKSAMELGTYVACGDIR